MPTLPQHKTKIVCTIGPACNSIEMLVELIRGGMNIARLNFSHGDFEQHANTIEKIRSAEQKAGRHVAILADLPGPKMRVGTFEQEPVVLKKGAEFTLTTRPIVGNASRVSISLKELPSAVQPGDTLFLNDGLIQIRVENVEGEDIRCTVLVGGMLRSHKGLNIPGIDLGIGAFTSRDHECLRFALEHGVDAVSQSFVNRADDIRNVRQAAAELGHRPFVVAKIERASALDVLEDIIREADGIMVARGDLGVEMPIERIAVAQKFITRSANRLEKPVITATQMLESMTHNRRPTRAEATDVANAILDGTDAVMLSEESAMGEYPLEAVRTLARIATATEPYIHKGQFREPGVSDDPEDVLDVIAASAEKLVAKLNVPVVFCPTDSGATPRSLTRFRLPCWIIAPTMSPDTYARLMFSYGVWPLLQQDKPVYWGKEVKAYAGQFGFADSSALVIEGPSNRHPETDHRLELVSLDP